MPPAVSHDLWRVVELSNQTQSHTRREVRDTEVRNVLKPANGLQCGTPNDNRGWRHEVHSVRSQHVACSGAWRIVRQDLLRKPHPSSDRTAQSSFPCSIGGHVCHGSIGKHHIFIVECLNQTR